MVVIFDMDIPNRARSLLEILATLHLGRNRSVDMAINLLDLRHKKAHPDPIK